MPTWRTKSPRRRQCRARAQLGICWINDHRPALWLLGAPLFCLQFFISLEYSLGIFNSPIAAIGLTQLKVAVVLGGIKTHSSFKPLDGWLHLSPLEQKLPKLIVRLGVVRLLARYIKKQR